MRDIDAIVAHLSLTHPDITVTQLAVLHPGADADGLWFFRHPAIDAEVQLESSTGTCPFLFESSGSVDRITADTIEQAATLVVAGLGIFGPAGRQLDKQG